MMNQELKNREPDMKELSFIERFRIPTFDSLKDMETGNVFVDPEKCTECGRCVAVCPGGAIESEKFNRLDYLHGRAKGKCGKISLFALKPGLEVCISCSNCIRACLTGARTLDFSRQWNPGLFYKRLAQTSTMVFPKKY